MLLLAALVTLLAVQSDLKIVVIAGEDAVNVIQQKTAVAPIVEVRDRNDQPVSGATILFALGRDSRATFAGGARVLTVTTDGAGRATATGLTPTAKGAIRITVTTKFAGQTATVEIAQTNVETAAQAASIAGAAGAGAAAVAAAGAAAGGASAGISGGVIAAIAGAAGGGALVAVKAASGSDNSANTSTGPPTSSTLPPSPGNPQPAPAPAPVQTTYSGPINSRYDMTTTTVGGNVSSTCVSTRVIAGTLTIPLTPQNDGSVTGRASTNGSVQEVSVAGPLCSPQPGPAPFAVGGDLAGSSASFGFSFQNGPSGQGVKSTVEARFTGSLSGTTITGTLTYTETTSGIGFNNATVNGSGSTTIPVTLTRQ